MAAHTAVAYAWLGPGFNSWELRWLCKWKNGYRPSGFLTNRTESNFKVSTKGPWRNGSASDSRSEGWAFESLWPHFHLFTWLPHGCLGLRNCCWVSRDWLFSGITVGSARVVGNDAQDARENSRGWQQQEAVMQCFCVSPPAKKTWGMGKCIPPGNCISPSIPYSV